MYFNYYLIFIVIISFLFFYFISFALQSLCAKFYHVNSLSIIWRDILYALYSTNYLWIADLFLSLFFCYFFMLIIWDEILPDWWIEFIDAISAVWGIAVGAFEVVVRIVIIVCWLILYSDEKMMNYKIKSLLVFCR